MPFDGRTIVESQSSIELLRNGRAERLTLGEDVVINLRVDPAGSLEAPLVFAGYGLTVPEMKFDDLAGLDLKGKIVVTFGGGPTHIPGNLRSHYGYATERGRFFEQAGIVGFITIQNPRTSDIPWSRSSLARLQEAMTAADPTLEDMKSVKLSATVNAEMPTNGWRARDTPSRNCWRSSTPASRCPTLPCPPRSKPGSQ